MMLKCYLHGDNKTHICLNRTISHNEYFYCTFIVLLYVSLLILHFYLVEILNAGFSLVIEFLIYGSAVCV